ncbi:ROK family glucokinase [Nocardioides cavernaquae]|uniref:Glucokinase n=1 Tax=Nocardioides cavernaquae TaxID=2321396 RepID=A0A3A5H282_9ACTN|nr:ROK family glucokinase [Nocardioides cavernaquae]RJS44832.1 ROK family protein [Nocardioides cavernaquae]
MSLTIGVDVGGTKIAAGVVSDSGEILAELRTESPADSVIEIEATIASLVAELRLAHEVTAIGVGAAGFIDNSRSRVLFSPNLAWKDLDLRSDLERLTGLPVVVENDANAAAWGEFTFGAGADAEDLLLVTVGTGVGGGIVMDGELVRGGFGVAAEIGHIRLVRGGIECGCGLLGCLESYGSGTALVRQTQEAAAADPSAAAALLEGAGGDVEAITGPMVTEAAQAGDPFAVARLVELGTWLGEGIASLASVLDPGVVTLGGGVSAAGDLLLVPTRASFLANLTGRGHRPEADFRLARLGNKAGMIGAADLARR